MTQKLEDDIFKLLQSQEITTHIASILKGIRFGSIEIVVHDGRIVQIEKHEKFRVKNYSISTESIGDIP
jgi:hypothetical protein